MLVSFWKQLEWNNQVVRNLSSGDIEEVFFLYVMQTFDNSILLQPYNAFLCDFHLPDWLWEQPFLCNSYEDLYLFVKES